MKKFGPFMGIVLLVSCVTGQLAAQSADGSGRSGKVAVPPEKARPVTIPNVSTQLVIDGRPDEEVWQRAAVFKDFFQTDPGYNTAPSKPTEVYMLYDDKNLYVAFKCPDERDKINATMAKRDNLENDDAVSIWLDTYDDRRRAYYFEFNPYGIQQDSIFTEGRQPENDYSVDIVMESMGVIEDWGWSVEVKIPFKSLRYAAGKGKYWGFNAARSFQRFNEEMDEWMPADRDVSGRLIKHGRITGPEEIKYERTFEVMPTIAASQAGLRKRTISGRGNNPFGEFDPIRNPIGVQDPGKFTNDPIMKGIGVNLKYMVSPDVTLDAAINPDYAETEADALIVAANQRSPLFFSEKRPLFLEGNDMFESPLAVFDSRAIVDPDYAVKISGKMEKTTFGLLAASDNAPGNYSQEDRDVLIVCQEGRADDIANRRTPRTCSSIESLLDKNAMFGVFRIKRDFGSENNIGFFATARTFPKNRNLAGGFDGRLKLNPKTTMMFQVLETYSKKSFRSGYRVGNGFGYFWKLDSRAETHAWSAEVTGLSKDYRADAGFFGRTDSNSVSFSNRFNTRSNPSARIVRASWSQSGSSRFNFRGIGRNSRFNTGVNMTLQGNLFVSVNAGTGHEKLFAEDFGGRFAGAPKRSAKRFYYDISLDKTVNKQLSVSGSAGITHNAFDSDFGAGQRFPRASPAFKSYLDNPKYFEYIRSLYLYQADPNRRYPGFSPPPVPDPGTGRQFNASVSFEYKPVDPLRMSLNYGKSKLKRHDTSRLASDSNSFSMNSTYALTRFAYVRARWDYDTLSSNANGQILFGWNPNPGTAFYVGYNDDFNYNGFNPFTNQGEPGFARNSRTLFIRASKLFRKSF